MLHLVTALILAATPSVCCERPSTPFALNATTTETSHKVGHVITPAVLTASVYGTAMYLGANRKQARWIAVGLSLAFIVGKELHDYRSEARAFSPQDVVLGAAGTAAGLWFAESIKWSRQE